MLRRGVLLSLIILAMLPGCTHKGEQRGAAQKEAPNFTLKDLNGKDVRLSDFKGKVVLLDFWATWCPPCRASIPGLEHLHKRFKDKGLVVLAISLDYGGWEDVKTFTTEYGITYTVLKGTDDVAVKYLARTIPMLVLVDKKGNIQSRFIGFEGPEEVENEIKAML